MSNVALISFNYILCTTEKIAWYSNKLLTTTLYVVLGLLEFEGKTSLGLSSNLSLEHIFVFVAPSYNRMNVRRKFSLSAYLSIHYIKYNGLKDEQRAELSVASLYKLYCGAIVRRYDDKKSAGLGFRSAIPRQTGCTIDHVKYNSSRQALNGQSDILSTIKIQLNLVLLLLLGRYVR